MHHKALRRGISSLPEVWADGGSTNSNLMVKTQGFFHQDPPRSTKAPVARECLPQFSSSANFPHVCAIYALHFDHLNDSGFQPVGFCQESLNTSVTFLLMEYLQWKRFLLHTDTRPRRFARTRMWDSWWLATTRTEAECLPSLRATHRPLSVRCCDERDTNDTEISEMVWSFQEIFRVFFCFPAFSDR